MSCTADPGAWFDATREMRFEFCLLRPRLRCGVLKLGRPEASGEGNGGENDDSGLQAGIPSDPSDGFLVFLPNKGGIFRIRA